MNLEEKIERVRYLNNQNGLSDQEHKEREDLEKELFTIRNDMNKVISKVTTNSIKGLDLTEIPTKSKAIAIIKSLVFKKPETPATKEEITQLGLELEKAQLKREIALAKLNTPRKSDRLFQAVGGIIKAVAKETSKPGPAQKKPITHKKLEKDWWKEKKWRIDL